MPSKNTCSFHYPRIPYCPHILHQSFPKILRPFLEDNEQKDEESRERNLGVCACA